MEFVNYIEVFGNLKYLEILNEFIKNNTVKRIPNDKLNLESSWDIETTIEEGILKINTHSAAVPEIKPWDKLIKEYVPDGTYYFESVNDDCDVYKTNNPKYKGLYYINFFIENVVYDICTEEANEEYILNIFKKYLNIYEEDFDDAVDEAYSTLDELSSKGIECDLELEPWQIVDIYKDTFID